MKQVHFLGISGSGISAVASIAKNHGFLISGCDRSVSYEFLDQLKDLKVLSGHSKTHLDGIDILAISPAILSSDPENEELVEARKKGIEVLTWQQFLGKYLLQGRFVIAICGTNGKSTTTALLAKVLEDSLLDPTVILGAKINDWGVNFRVGKSQYVVLEADEYNNNFHSYIPSIAVVLNIDEDHLEFFGNIKGISDSFEKFLSQTKQTIVANLKDENVAEVIKWVMKNPNPPAVLDYTKTEIDLNLQIPGRFNNQNAKAVFEVGLLLGIEPTRIIKSLNNFKGIGRRAELIGEINGAKIYSDFAHNPTKVELTIEAFKEKYPEKKLFVVFQPHLFSRTKLLFDKFVRVFQNAQFEKAFIVSIYPSREIDPRDIKSEMLVEAIGRKDTRFKKTVEETWQEIKGQIGESDIVLFLGAGDIDSKIRTLLKS